jgi:hypothetical protein
MVTSDKLAFVEHKLKELEGMLPTPAFALLVWADNVDMDVRSTSDLLGDVRPSRIDVKDP